MSKGKHLEHEEGRENSCGYDMEFNGEKDVLDADADGGIWIFSHCHPLKKFRSRENEKSQDLNLNLFSFIEDNSCSDVEPQDADYAYVPSLSNDLEALILARVPRFEHWKFSFVSKRFLSLSKSGELFRIRKEIGFKEPSVFMLPSGESSWWTFDYEFKSRRKLPVLPSDYNFTFGDKESLCAGTHLIVSGKEAFEPAIWRYELLANEWFKGPSMIDPRCLFASATCGTFSFVAGGISMEDNTMILDSAEKYNPETKSWSPLPQMYRKRKSCAGCYMDNKFYAIGGLNQKEESLTCGEAFDVETKRWELIPDMIKDFPVLTSQSPPLIAVVDNELYMIEASSNELMVYLKRSNSWKKLGPVPVRANHTMGWGVAFKSLGNELLVMGASSGSHKNSSMTIHTCCPDPAADRLSWKPLEYGNTRLSHFILNCSVMQA